MKRLIFSLFLLVLCVGCKTTTKKDTSTEAQKDTVYIPKVKAEGFCGIGKIKMKEHYDSVIVHLKKFYVSDCYDYIGGMSGKIDREMYPELKTIDAYYDITPEDEIYFSLSFYRDTLVYINFYGNTGYSEEIVKKGLKAKYGDGDVQRYEYCGAMVTTYRYIGEYTLAQYTDCKYDSKREFLTIIATDRDYKSEIEEYEEQTWERIQREREKERLREEEELMQRLKENM